MQRMTQTIVHFTFPLMCDLAIVSWQYQQVVFRSRGHCHAELRRRGNGRAAGSHGPLLPGREFRALDLLRRNLPR